MRLFAFKERATGKPPPVVEFTRWAIYVEWLEISMVWEVKTDKTSEWRDTIGGYAFTVHPFKEWLTFDYMKLLYDGDHYILKMGPIGLYWAR